MAIDDDDLLPSNIRKRLSKTFGIAVDNCNSKIGLEFEMIVDAGFSDSKYIRDIFITKGTVSARLYQHLCEIEYFLRGLRPRGLFEIGSSPVLHDLGRKGPASPKNDGTFFGAKAAARTARRRDRHR